MESWINYILAWPGISIIVNEQCAAGKKGNVYAELDKLGLISKHEKAASQFNISQTVRIFDEKVFNFR